MRLVAVALLAACAPPPEVELAGQASGEPFIEILFPEPEQEIALDPGCVLTVPIVVWVSGVTLTPPDPENVVEGQGHWHGGPDLDNGYCVTSGNACQGSETGGGGFYNGSTVAPGTINLQVELQDNAHDPLGPADKVEVTIVNPPGEDCSL